MFTKHQLTKLEKLLKTDKGYVEIASEMGVSYNTFRLLMANSDKKVERILVDKDAEPVYFHATVAEES